MSAQSAQPPPQQPPQPTKEEADMAQSLAQDRPTIDAAIKSYVSLICAKALTASDTDNNNNNNNNAISTTPGTTTTATIVEEDPKTLLGLIPSAGLGTSSTTATTATTNNNTAVQPQILQLARIMLQTLNQYTFPIHCTVLGQELLQKPNLAQDKKLAMLELSIAAQLWNGLVQSNQKPSRFLGRRALRHAWKNHQLGAEIRTKVQQQQQQQPSPEVLSLQLQWLDEFERLLFFANNNATVDDDDSALLWAPDGGANELAKRQARRRQAATQRG